MDEIHFRAQREMLALLHVCKWTHPKEVEGQFTFHSASSVTRISFLFNLKIFSAKEKESLTHSVKELLKMKHCV